MAFGQLTEFDKIVKSALEGVEEAVPSSVWDGIVSKLDVIAGAAAAGAAISSVSTGSAASGSAASGAAAGSTAAGSAATGSVASGAATGTVASSASVTGAAAGTTATGAAGSAATAAAGGAVAASSNVITITLASVAAAGVIGGGAALVLTNSNNQHIIDQPKQVTEVVVDTTSETMLEQMPEDTVDLVRYIGHQKSVIDESMPVGETEKHHPEEEKEPESIKTDVPAPKAYKLATSILWIRVGQKWISAGSISGCRTTSRLTRTWVWPQESITPTLENPMLAAGVSIYSIQMRRFRSIIWISLFISTVVTTLLRIFRQGPLPGRRSRLACHLA